MLIVYPARAMTGEKAADVVVRAMNDKLFMESCGLVVLCPVAKEGVVASDRPIQATKTQMDDYWSADKALIREAHVVFNMSPDKPSLGVIREHGYARYHLWKKVISVFPPGKIPKEGAVCHYEDDFVCDDLGVAIDEAKRTHGTFWKRIKWRLGIYRRSWLKAVYHRLQEWK